MIPIVACEQHAQTVVERDQAPLLPHAPLARLLVGAEEQEIQPFLRELLIIEGPRFLKRYQRVFVLRSVLKEQGLLAEGMQATLEDEISQILEAERKEREQEAGGRAQWLQRLAAAGESEESWWSQKKIKLELESHKLSSSSTRSSSRKSSSSG